ncbi:MAG: hypothetical protein KC713_05035 [Candidatus Omnitrophica bacterium]|nr:hypothetical protein [Candidatus Omnitrophota bacterium]
MDIIIGIFLVTGLLASLFGCVQTEKLLDHFPTLKKVLGLEKASRPALLYNILRIISFVGAVFFVWVLYLLSTQSITFSQMKSM